MKKRWAMLLLTAMALLMFAGCGVGTEKTESGAVINKDYSEKTMTTVSGEDVDVAEFTAWETTNYDDEDNPVAILVSFSEVSAIEANTPYIINVSSEISEFVVDGVDIQAEEEPCVTIGRTNRGTFGSFTGSYVPMTIDEECLFLSGNKFWYSTGLTQMKGYRAFFYFQDILGGYSVQQVAAVKLCIKHDNGIVTYINSVDTDIQTQNGSYNINGVKVGKNNKGLIIRNRKKYLKK